MVPPPPAGGAAQAPSPRRNTLAEGVPVPSRATASTPEVMSPAACWCAVGVRASERRESPSAILPASAPERPVTSLCAWVWAEGGKDVGRPVRALYAWEWGDGGKVVGRSVRSL